MPTIPKCCGWGKGKRYQELGNRKIGDNRRQGEAAIFVVDAIVEIALSHVWSLRMLEWWAAATGIELGKLVLEQVLDLGKPVLEGYVQDFFKDCLSSGVARLNAATLKTPMAEAIGYFIKRFIKELQLNDVPETSISHHYQAAIKKFVQNKAVRPILGKAFEKDCKQIDYARLEKIWTDQYQDSGWQFPAEEFDWRGVCKEYVYEARGIVKANPELREILNSDLLEDIARNTAQLSPGFNLNAYRESIQSSYGYLKLYTLDSTDRVDAIKLWSMFIEQTVREALPPMRYDLPLDLKRQLQAEGQLEADLSPEALEHYRHEYFQRPARKVLEAVADSHRVVILGDPGSGKSSLLQYLALEWVEGKTENLPLLIELREFALNPVANFLEFLHRGRSVDWQFDQQQLHQHLLESPTLVMFDGLDEVFDRATQSTIIDDIIRFSQQYPNAQILVTSRIIGYNPERLQHSGFRHFTLQALDTDEIHEFIDRWYDLSMGSDPDKVRLKQRLKDAIENSKAIANLAGNPLLLAMMARLNRDKNKDLPQNKIALYSRASELLLYKWDCEAKSDLKDPRWQKYPVEIDYQNKQEMLQRVAYFIQESSEGLKGNLISRENLEDCLKSYLKSVLEANNSPSIAKLLVDQLHKRDSVLCHYGAKTYGFVHRTFLEYFCAIEIVRRLEKQNTITFEQLRDEIFGQHWQDEVWHEVLKLTCGMIRFSFSQEIIHFLLGQEDSSGRFTNIFMADSIVFEHNNKESFSCLKEEIFERLKKIILFAKENFEIQEKKFYEKWANQDEPDCLRSILIFDEAMKEEWIEFVEDESQFYIELPQSALEKYPDSGNILAEMSRKILMQEIDLVHPIIQSARAIIEHHSDNPEGFIFLADNALDLEFKHRDILWGSLIHICRKNPKNIKLLRKVIITDPDEQLREWAQEQLSKIEIGE